MQNNLTENNAEAKSAGGKPLGRRPHKPTAADRAKVERMASMGMPQYQIALVIEISEKTLRKRYKEELSKSSVHCNLRVAETLFQMATSGKNAAATIFWAKTRCGFRIPPPPVTDANGNAAPTAPSRYLTEPPPPGSIQIVDSKGERLA